MCVCLKRRKGIWGWMREVPYQHSTRATQKGESKCQNLKLQTHAHTNHELWSEPKKGRKDRTKKRAKEE